MPSTITWLKSYARPKFRFMADPAEGPYDRPSARRGATPFTFAPAALPSFRVKSGGTVSPRTRRRPRTAPIIPRISKRWKTRTPPLAGLSGPLQGARGRLCDRSPEPARPVLRVRRGRRGDMAAGLGRMGCARHRRPGGGVRRFGPRLGPRACRTVTSPLVCGL